jgi:hypothetical protein
MALFQRDFLTLLYYHIKELENSGVLPVDWQWKPKKVKELKEIVDNLINDLNHLHETIRGEGDNIPEVMPLLIELYRDLKDMLEEHGEEHKTEEINNLIHNLNLAFQDFQKYGHLSEAEKQHYLNLQKKASEKHRADCDKWREGGEKGPEPMRPTKAYRYLKKLWNKRVDRKFIQQIYTIHWGLPNSLKYLVQNLKRNHEISTIGYIKSPFKNYFMFGLGILVKGHVTFAANTDARSDNRPIPRTDPRYVGQKYSWGDMEIILNKHTFVDLSQETSGYCEFIIDNWKPEAIIVNFQEILKYNESRLIEYFGSTEYEDIKNKIKEFAKELKLPLLDINLKPIE